jgi:Tfp pilus assembly protein PilV
MSSRHGLTLIEVSVSTLLVGLMIVASLRASGGVTQCWTAASDEYRAAMLADQLLFEILQNPYEEPDDPALFGLESGESGGTRVLWDDADDFDGCTSNPPTSPDGTVLSEFSGWSRAATVRLAALSDPAVTPGTDEGLKMIEVSVTAPGGETIVRQALRSRWGPLDDQQPLVDVTWITSVNTSLTLQTGATSMTRTCLTNSVEDAP